MNESSSEPVARDQLTEWLEAAARPDRSAHLVGTELENFGLVERDDGGVRPVSYEEHVGPVFQAFIDRFGWRPGTDRGVGGELIALERDRASITLEPGGQFELSGKPLPHVHATCEEFTRHYNELHEASLPLEIAWLAVGFHPLAKLDDISKDVVADTPPVEVLAAVTTWADTTIGSTPFHGKPPWVCLPLILMRTVSPLANCGPLR